MIDIVIPSYEGQSKKLIKVMDDIKNVTTIPYNIIAVECRRSAAENINTGLRIANTPYVCIVDNDIVPKPGWLEHLVKVLDKYNDIGMVSSKVVNTDGKKYVNMYSMAEYNMISEVNTVGGTCTLIRRSAGILQDENYKGIWYNDTDFACEFRKQGWRVVIDGYSLVEHSPGNTNISEYIKHNEKYFYSKWADMNAVKRNQILSTWRME